MTHERLVAERERIRGARSFFARQLGPLPTFAGISIGLVATFSEKITHRWALCVALAFFACMVAASIAYSRMPTYRELRHHQLHPPNGRRAEEGTGAMTAARWYEVETKLEDLVYGTPRKPKKLWVWPSKAQYWGRPWRAWYWPRRDFSQSLQVQMDKERFGVFLVQILFLLVIAFLVIGS